MAGEVKENLREPAQQAVESVKSTAQDAKDTVAEEGRAATQDVHGPRPGRRGQRPEQLRLGLTRAATR